MSEQKSFLEYAGLNYGKLDRIKILLFNIERKEEFIRTERLQIERMKKEIQELQK